MVVCERTFSQRTSSERMRMNLNIHSCSKRCIVRQTKAPTAQASSNRQPIPLLLKNLMDTSIPKVQKFQRTPSSPGASHCLADPMTSHLTIVISRVFMQVGLLVRDGPMSLDSCSSNRSNKHLKNSNFAVIEVPYGDDVYLMFLSMNSSFYGLHQ